jgi:23S rRNA (uridine2552-2'-O)-methyltransferase
LSKLRDRSHRHDVFHRRAKQQGFVARSVFKLEEIDQKCKLLRRGGRVLDLGCRPGPWLQYASGVVGPEGALVGIDRTPLDKPVASARIVVGDVSAVSIGRIAQGIDRAVRRRQRSPLTKRHNR